MIATRAAIVGFLPYRAAMKSAIDVRRSALASPTMRRRIGMPAVNMITGPI